MNPIREVWDDVGEVWNRRRPQRSWRAHSDGLSRRLVADWLGASPIGAALKTDAFDEAFGEGVATDPLLRVDQMWVVDLSRTTARTAHRRSGRLRIAVCDVRRLPFGDGAFDAVLSLSTLDHFDEPAEIHAALREIARVLGPGGRLIVTLDNPRNPVVRLRNRLPYAWLKHARLVPYPVGVTLDGESLSRSLSRAGLEVVGEKVVMHCPRAPAVLFAGLIDRWGGSRMKSAYFRLTKSFEGLARWPTRRWTGYYIAALAVKVESGQGPPRSGS